MRTDPRLRELLELASELETLTDRLEDSITHAEKERVGLRRRQLVRRILQGSLRERDLPPVFVELRRRFRLRPGELVLILVLFNRRIMDGPSFLRGRDLLAPLATSSFELLRVAPLLDPDGRLVRSGLVQARLLLPGASLDAEFRLSDAAWRGLCREIWRRPTAPDAVPAPTPYLGSMEHLTQLQALVELHARRAALLFPTSIWADPDEEPALLKHDLDDAILTLRAQILERERLTSADVPLPPRQLRSEHDLEDDEEIILLSLFFQELFGRTYNRPDPIDLVRLVCTRAEDVLRKIELLRPEGALRAEGLVELDEIGDGDLPVEGDIVASPWVRERLLAGAREGASIREEEQRRFNRFLDGLEDSEDFYRHL